MTAPTATPPTTEPLALRALRLVALVETASFAVLLVCSVLKRTTSFDAVPVMGPIHGVLFLALVGLVLDQREQLGWSARRTLLTVTVGSPFAHFLVNRR
jgi:integral membrane protein